MSDKKFDVVVIGGGPAGYPAALRAAQLGLSAACIDDYKNEEGVRLFGGTCLNVGCIPSKALLESSELYHRAHTEFQAHGIHVAGLGIDIEAMQARKRGIVKQLTSGIEAMFKAGGVIGIQGPRQAARRQSRRGHDGGRRRGARSAARRARDGLHADRAADCEVRRPAHRRLDGRARRSTDVPKRLGVIGAGVIGLELGSRLEAARLRGRDPRGARDVPADGRSADREGSAAPSEEAGARHPARRQGHGRGRRRCNAVKVRYETGGAAQELVVDALVVAVGRRPVTAGLFGPDVKVPLDKRGFIEVDEKCRTTVPNVWAVGDVVRGPMLAHKGMEEGVMVAELIAGHVAEMNYRTIPSVIYTAPEIAWVGQTEEEVKASGRPYKVGTFSFAANGRAKGMQQTAGLVKLIADQEHDDVLGVHIVGPVAGELIAEAVLAMEFSASAEDIQRTIHAHPTLSEALHEASLAADKRAIHGINR